MNHPIVYIEFPANNHAEAAQWYADLFGWKIGSPPGQDFSTGAWSEERSLVAGFSPVSDVRPPGTVVAYIVVDDLEAAMARVAAAGGTLLTQRTETPAVGAWCWFKDPTGNVVALFTPERK